MRAFAAKRGHDASAVPGRAQFVTGMLYFEHEPRPYCVRVSVEAVMSLRPFTITVSNNAELVVPARIRRKAGIKPGDCLQLVVSPRITITAVEPTYKPTRSEWAAIRKGEAALARGDSVSLAEFLNVDAHRRKTSSKGGRKVPR